METSRDQSSTLHTLAEGYRETSIRLRLALEDIDEAIVGSRGGKRAELEEQQRVLKQALQQARDLRELCERYYSAPRPEGYTSAGWTAPRQDSNRQ